jgi:hypothetical protein
MAVPGHYDGGIFPFLEIWVGFALWSIRFVELFEIHGWLCRGTMYLSKKAPYLGACGIFTLFEIWVGFRLKRYCKTAYERFKVLWSIRFVKFSYSRFTDGCAGVIRL